MEPSCARPISGNAPGYLPAPAPPHPTNRPTPRRAARILSSGRPSRRCCSRSTKDPRRFRSKRRAAAVGKRLAGWNGGCAQVGGTFRGYKATYAETHGAIGLIIYSDSTDGGYTVGFAYLEGRLLNEKMIQPNYDNVARYECLSDTSFIYGPALARVDGVLALRLAHADAVPYDVLRYAADLADHVAGLEQRGRVLDLDVQLDRLKADLAALTTAAAAFGTARPHDADQPVFDRRELRRLNPSLVYPEKAFIYADGWQSTNLPLIYTHHHAAQSNLL